MRKIERPTNGGLKGMSADLGPLRELEGIERALTEYLRAPNNEQPGLEGKVSAALDNLETIFSALREKGVSFASVGAKLESLIFDLEGDPSAMQAGRVLQKLLFDTEVKQSVLKRFDMPENLWRVSHEANWYGVDQVLARGAVLRAADPEGFQKLLQDPVRSGLPQNIAHCISVIASE